MNRSASARGSLLVVTLWLITLLSILAVAIGRFLSLEVRLAKYRAARQQARVLARSGVYLAIQRLAQDAAAPEATGKVYDWLFDEWAVFPQAQPDADPTRWTVPAETGEVAIQIRDEARKLNLNTATMEQLARLTGRNDVAQVIVDAYDEPDAREDLPTARPPYFAKNAPMAAPEELRDLPGMSAELYAVLAAEASPYRRETEPMNLNTATAEVLRAAGLSESAVQLVLRFREGVDGPNAHEQDGIFEEAGVAILEALKRHQGVELTGSADGNLLISNAFGVTSTTFTISAEARVPRPSVTARVQAVVRRADCGEGVPVPCIIAWREG